MTQCPNCQVEMFYVASMVLGKQSWSEREEFDECPKCAFRIKRPKRKDK